MTSKGKPQDENPPGKTCSGNVAPASTPAAVVELVERFRRNLDAYRNPSYKEAHVRREFIDPRFHLGPSGKIVLVPYRVERQKAVLIPEEALCKELPRTWQYLSANKRHLQEREGGRMRGSAWHGYVYPKNLEVMKSPRILVPDIADRASFALDSAGRYAFTSGYGIVLRKDVKESAEYFLGLLTSKLLDFYLKRVSTTMRGGFFRYFTQYLEQLPIRRIDFLGRTDRQRHDRLVQLVVRMQRLQERLVSLKHPTTRQPIQRLIDHADRKIDELVYGLYGLTKDEIGILEGADKE